MLTSIYYPPFPKACKEIIAKNSTSAGIYMVSPSLTVPLSRRLRNPHGFWCKVALNKISPFVSLPRCNRDTLFRSREVSTSITKSHVCVSSISGTIKPVLARLDSETSSLFPFRDAVSDDIYPSLLILFFPRPISTKWPSNRWDPSRPSYPRLRVPFDQLPNVSNHPLSRHP